MNLCSRIGMTCSTSLTEVICGSRHGQAAAESEDKNRTVFFSGSRVRSSKDTVPHEEAEERVTEAGDSNPFWSD